MFVLFGEAAAGEQCSDPTASTLSGVSPPDAEPEISPSSGPSPVTQSL